MKQFGGTALVACRVVLASFTVSCATTESPARGPGSVAARAAAPEVEWTAAVAYAARGAIERIRCGRPDAADPRLQAVSVDQAGDVALVHFGEHGPRAEVLYRNGVELTGLVLADVDAAEPGVEIYVGGYQRGPNGEEAGGIVLQLVVTSGANGGVRVRTIYTGPAFVHSIEFVEPQPTDGGAGLLVSTYAGEVHRLAPNPTGPWRDELLHREPPSADAEALKVKDAAFLRDPDGRPRHTAFIALKTGRLVCLDLDRPGAARVVHEEPGGLSRITPDADGGAYVTGYSGRLLHFTRDGDGFRFDVLDQEGVDSGLRGVVLGDFPAANTTAHFAVFGFHKKCRALVTRAGVLDPVTLFVDSERGHTIEAGDFVPDNDADELLVGGYSKQVTLLVARRR